MAVNIAKTDTVIAVVPEYHSGPGWSNYTLRIVVMNESMKLRLEYLQPEEFSAEIQVLFRLGASAHEALHAAVGRLRAKGPTRKTRRR